MEVRVCRYCGFKNDLITKEKTQKYYQCSVCGFDYKKMIKSETFKSMEDLFKKYPFAEEWIPTAKKYKEILNKIVGLKLKKGDKILVPIKLDIDNGYKDYLCSFIDYCKPEKDRPYQSVHFKIIDEAQLGEDLSKYKDEDYWFPITTLSCLLSIMNIYENEKGIKNNPLLEEIEKGNILFINPEPLISEVAKIHNEKVRNEKKEDKDKRNDKVKGMFKDIEFTIEE